MEQASEKVEGLVDHMSLESRIPRSQLVLRGVVIVMVTNDGGVGSGNERGGLLIIYTLRC